MDISIKFKMLFLIVSTLVVATISILIAANNQFIEFIDNNQQTLYEEKVNTILGILQGYKDRLQMTGQVEAYSDGFKQSAVNTLKKTYYHKKNQPIFPIIINDAGKLMMHPQSFASDVPSLATSGIIRNMLASDKKRANSFIFENKWYVYTHFIPWNWVVAYTVPLDVKYENAYILRRTLFSIMIAITTLTIIIMWLMILRITRPIETLTQSTKAVASGNYASIIDVKGSDEVNQLAYNFNQMTTAIQKQIIALNKEIDDRRQAETTLQKNKERLAIALNASNSGIWDWNIKTGAIFFDDNYFLIAGYEPDDFPHSFEEWEKRVHPDDIDKIQDQIQLYIKGKIKTFRVEFRFKTKTNEWMWILGQGKISEYDTKKQPTRFTGTHLDITERKNAELALSAEKERLSVTLASIGDGVITTDMNGKIVLLNNAAQTITGWHSDDAAGRALMEVFNIIDQHTEQPCENPFEKILAAGKIVEMAKDTCLVKKDGKKIVIADSGAPIHNHDGQIIGVVLVFRDMTEKQKLADYMQKSQKLESLGILAGGIAHDFNNLLGIIFGHIEMSIAETTDTKAKAYLSESLNSIDRARGLTLQLLTFAKGGAPVKKVGALFPFVQKTARFVLSGSSILCKFQIPEDIWPCSFDKNQIGQVIENLTINAQQAMPNGGTIEISACNVSLSEKEHISLAPGNYVKLSVKDQGTGILPQTLPHIFDPYYTTKSSGQGLGLSTCYSIIKRHGGSMDVKSEPDKGSVFRVYLPASNKTIPTQTKASDGNHNGDGTFLVMDDEKAIRNFLKIILESFGYTVVLKKNGEEAVDFFTEETNANRKIAGMLFDLTIPGGMDGKTLIAKIRQICPDTPAFVASGYSDNPIMANPEEYGFNASISKPFMKAELARMLEKHMKSSE